MKKKNWIILGSITTILLLMSSNKTYAAPTKSKTLRGCDPKGCGHFGAPRGSRLHMGVDFKASINEPIYSPVSGKVSRLPYAASDLMHRGVEIVSGKETHIVFYVKPTVKIGDTVNKGQLIGYADDIVKKYGSTITNHVHHQVKISGKYIDTTKKYEL